MVRFAPKGSYKLGEHTFDSLSKDGNVISEYGQEVAKKLGEIAQSEYFRYDLTVEGLNIEEGLNPLLRVSALCGYDNRLRVDGDFGVNWDGRSFGVFK